MTTDLNMGALTGGVAMASGVADAKRQESKFLFGDKESDRISSRRQ